MAIFVEEILEDISWRISEMVSIKSIPIQYSFNASHREQYIKFAIPAVYSLWEGFIKTSLSIYLKHLNSLNIDRSEISANILTHYIDTCCKLSNPRNDFKSKLKLVEHLDSLFIDKIIFSLEIPTESNVNYKVLTSLLNRFCITCVDKKYENQLDRLLFFRNKISHGENALKVEHDDLNGFIYLIENLMFDIVINIEDSERSQTYKKQIL
ncbi:MAG: MAE_28990/MAE_18760 family HEPN-like nuclease [Nitrososphaeraceae archaeon]